MPDADRVHRLRHARAPHLVLDDQLQLGIGVEAVGPRPVRHDVPGVDELAWGGRGVCGEPRPHLDAPGIVFGRKVDLHLTIETAQPGRDKSRLGTAERVGCTGGAGMTMVTLIRHAHPQAAITGWWRARRATPVSATSADSRPPRCAIGSWRSDSPPTSCSRSCPDSGDSHRSWRPRRRAGDRAGLRPLRAPSRRRRRHPVGRDPRSLNVVPYETPDEPFSPGGEYSASRQRATRVLAEVTARYPERAGDDRVARGLHQAVCLQLLGARLSVPRDIPPVTGAHVDDHVDDEHRARGISGDSSATTTPPTSRACVWCHDAVHDFADDRLLARAAAGQRRTRQ